MYIYTCMYIYIYVDLYIHHDPSISGIPRRRELGGVGLNERYAQQLGERA